MNNFTFLVTGGIAACLNDAPGLCSSASRERPLLVRFGPAEEPRSPAAGEAQPRSLQRSEIPPDTNFSSQRCRKPRFRFWVFFVGVELERLRSVSLPSAAAMTPPSRPPCRWPSARCAPPLRTAPRSMRSALERRGLALAAGRRGAKMAAAAGCA